MTTPLHLTPLPGLTLAADAEDVTSLLQEAVIGPRDGEGRLAVVAMSGGVDSAVSALIMRERGYRVVGMNLRLFSPEDDDHAANPCCGIPAMDDARLTCATIGVPFYALNMEREFATSVIDRFVDDYAAGRTPNPCLECNRHVKFRHLLATARELGAEVLATGHYARVVHGPDGQYHLLKARDERKDQSYVLHTMRQEHLRFIQFPLGNLRKTEVRQLAHHFGLPVAQKPESQEICFVGKGSYAEFVTARRPDAAQPGEIVDDAGRPLGRHDGLVRHTVGQRRGLRIPAAQPLYVLDIDRPANRLVVGPRERAHAAWLTAREVSFVADSWPRQPFMCDAVVRYRGAAHRATVTPSGADERSVQVLFEGEGPIAAPGQAVVLYDGDIVLGGGTIDRVVRQEGSHQAMVAAQAR